MLLINRPYCLVIFLYNLLVVSLIDVIKNQSLLTAQEHETCERLLNVGVFGLGIAAPRYGRCGRCNPFTACYGSAYAAQ